MVDVAMLLVLFNAVKEGIGELVPEDWFNPIEALFEPFQLNEVPVPELGELAVRFIWLIIVPAHTKMFEKELLTGFGLTVIV